MRAAANPRSAAQRPLPLPLLARAGLERSGKNPGGAAAPAPANRPHAPRRAIRPRTGAGASPIWLCRLGDWRSGGSCAAARSAPTLTRAPLHMRNLLRPFFQPCVRGPGGGSRSITGRTGLLMCTIRLLNPLTAAPISCLTPVCPCPLCRDHGVGAEGRQPGGGHLPPPAPAHGDFQRLVRAVRCAADPLCPLGEVWSSLNEPPPCATVEGWHASQGKLPGQLTVNCVGGTARRPKDAGRAAQTLVLELAPDLVSLPPQIRCSDVATTCRCRRLSVAQPLHNLPPPPSRTESCRWGQPRPN